MSRPSDAELQQLDAIAVDLKETFEERGHRVALAMAADDAFTSGNSRSALMRDLAIDAVTLSASRNGLPFRQVLGGGHELLGRQHTYRLRKARHDATGFVITASNESGLVSEEEPSLFPMEKWVLGWVPDDLGSVAEVFTAAVLGIEEGRPGRLVLGSAIALGTRDPISGGFTPTDEGLDFDDEPEVGTADDIGA
ncbi:hypothetical protein ACFPM7_19060 [Actinokineospora guangxiensis]|uniref:Uncharacterized protein n=1 Tax=Actinokineospora guangxiensis TaxID=1490288 RepID=A0ABW0ESY6_9PSEU